jgi:hypothetical protein
MKTLMMLHRSADVEANVSVDISGSLVFGFDVCHHQAPQWGKRTFHVIVLSVQVRVCQYFWRNVALLQ